MVAVAEKSRKTGAVRVWLAWVAGVGPRVPPAGGSRLWSSSSPKELPSFSPRSPGITRSAYPGLPSGWKVPHGPSHTSPVLPMHLRKGDLDLALFSTLTMFAMPLDVALQQLKIECFYPADTKTAEVARRLATAAAV